MEEVKDCVRDLRNLIVEAELDERKAFSSVIRTTYQSGQRTSQNRLSTAMAKNISKDSQKAGVLPIDTPGRSFGTVPELLFERKGLIPSIQQLLSSQI